MTHLRSVRILRNLGLCPLPSFGLRLPPWSSQEYVACRILYEVPKSYYLLPLARERILQRSFLDSVSSECLRTQKGGTVELTSSVKTMRYRRKIKYGGSLPVSLTLSFSSDKFFSLCHKVQTKTPLVPMTLSVPLQVVTTHRVLYLERSVVLVSFLTVTVGHKKFSFNFLCILVSSFTPRLSQSPRLSCNSWLNCRSVVFSILKPRFTAQLSRDSVES